MRTRVLCLIAAAGGAFASSAYAGNARVAAQRLFVLDTGTGTKGQASYVEYTLPNLHTAEYTAPYSFTTNFDVAKQTMYFANQGNVYSLPKRSGPTTPILLFGAPYAGAVTLDSKTHIYAINRDTNSVDEFTHEAVPGGGTKAPFRVIPLSPNQANFTIVDHQDNIWVALNNNTLAVYGPKGTKPITTINLASAIFDIKVDGAGTVWVMTNGIEPYPFTNCTPDNNGNVKRTPLIYSYVNLQLSKTLYSHENDTNAIGHLAVADDGRVYYSAGNEILDFDPGAQCPNDALTVSNLSTYAYAPLALDAGGDLYASDTANAAIYAYPPGSPTPSRVIQQKVSSQGQQLEVH